MADRAAGESFLSPYDISNLRDFNLFALIVTIIAAFQVFQQPLILTNGGPLNSTYTAAIHMYNNGFLYGKMGYASMMAWSLFVVIMVITLVVISTSKYWVFYDD